MSLAVIRMYAAHKSYTAMLPVEMIARLRPSQTTGEENETRAPSSY